MGFGYAGHRSNLGSASGSTSYDVFPQSAVGAPAAPDVIDVEEMEDEEAEAAVEAFVLLDEWRCMATYWSSTLPANKYNAPLLDALEQFVMDATILMTSNNVQNPEVTTAQAKWHELKNKWLELKAAYDMQKPKEPSEI